MSGVAQMHRDATALQCEQSQSSANNIKEQTDNLRKALREHQSRMAEADSGYTKQLKMDKVKAESAVRTAEVRIALLEKNQKESEQRLASLQSMVNQLHQTNASQAAQITTMSEQGRIQQANLEHQTELASQWRVELDEKVEALDALQTRLTKTAVEFADRERELTETSTQQLVTLAEKERLIENYEVLLREKQETVELLEQLRGQDTLETNIEASEAIESAAIQMEDVLAARESCINDLQQVESRAVSDKQKLEEERERLQLLHVQEAATLRYELEEAHSLIGNLEAQLESGQEKRNVDGELLQESLTRNSELEAARRQDALKIERLERVLETRGAFSTSQATQTTATFENIDALTTQLQQSKSSVVLLEQRCSSLEASNARLSVQLQTSNTVTEEDIIVLRECEAEMTKRDTTIEKLLTEGKRSKDELLASAAEVERLRGALSVEHSRQVELSAQHDEVHEMLQSTESSMQRLQEQNKRLKTQVSSAHQQKLDAQRVAKEATEKVATFEALVEVEKKEVNRFKDDLAKLFAIYKDALDDAQLAKEERDALAAVVDAKKNELSEAKQEVTVVETAKLQRQQDCTSLESVVSALTTKVKASEDTQQQATLSLMDAWRELQQSSLVPEEHIPSCVTNNKMPSSSDCLTLAKRLPKALNLVVAEAHQAVQFAVDMRQSIEDNIIAYTTDECVNVAIDVAFEKMSEQNTFQEDPAFKLVSSLPTRDDVDVAGSKDINAWVKGWSNVSNTIQKMAYVVSNYQLSVSSMQSTLTSFRGVLRTKERELQQAQAKLSRLMNSSAGRSEEFSMAQSSGGSLTNTAATGLSSIDLSFLAEKQLPLSYTLQRTLGSVKTAQACAERVYTVVVDEVDESGMNGDDAPRSEGRAALADELLPSLEQCTSTLRRAKHSLEWVITNCILPESVLNPPAALQPHVGERPSSLLSPSAILPSVSASSLGTSPIQPIADMSSKGSI